MPSGEESPGVSLFQKGNTISCVQTCVQTCGDCYRQNAYKNLDKEHSFRAALCLATSHHLKACCVSTSSCHQAMIKT
eukprot:1146598-Amphidinium_carterae.1